LLRVIKAGDSALVMLVDCGLGGACARRHEKQIGAASSVGFISNHHPNLTYYTAVVGGGGPTHRLTPAEAPWRAGWCGH